MGPVPNPKPEGAEDDALHDAGDPEGVREGGGGLRAPRRPRIQVKSRAEAIEWAKRAPMQDGDIIEVRQVQEISDFPPDVQKAAGR